MCLYLKALELHVEEVSFTIIGKQIRNEIWSELKAGSYVWQGNAAREVWLMYTGREENKELDYVTLLVKDDVDHRAKSLLAGNDRSVVGDVDGRASQGGHLMVFVLNMGRGVLG